MRSRTLLLVTCLCVVACLALFGCGDDSTTSNSQSLSGEEYQAVSNETNAIIDSTLSLIQSGLVTVLTADAGVDPGDLQATAGLFYGGSLPEMSGGFVGTWLVMYGSDISAAGTRFHVDSLAFWKDNQSLQASAGADYFELRHLSQYSVSDTTVSFSSYRNTGRFDFYHVDTDVATVGGQISSSLQYKEVTDLGTVWQYINVELTLTNALLDDTEKAWDIGCPSSGIIEGSAEYISVNEQLVVDTTLFEFSATTDDGLVNIMFSSEGQSRTYDYTLCTMGD